MAIVKMRRLELVALLSQREELLRALQDLGCVEISQPEEDPDLTGLRLPDERDQAALGERRQGVALALDVLDKFAPRKEGLFHPRPQVRRAELFDEETLRRAERSAGEISQAAQQLAAFQARLDKVKAQKEALAPWLDLDAPLDLTSSRETAVYFAAISPRFDFHQAAGAVAAVTDLAQLLPAGRDREARYFLLLCHRSAEGEALEALQPFGFTKTPPRGWTGTARENLARLEREEADLTAKSAAARQELAAMGEKREELRLAADRLDQELARAQARSRLRDTDAAFLLEGWFPAEREGEVAALLEGRPCAWETRDPLEEEYPQVPIQLRNNRLTDPFNVITEMYSMPAYDGVDPNPLMAPFFILFFGFMMNDIGYGLLMVLGTALYLKLGAPRGNTRKMMVMFWLCGLSSIFWGCLTGGFFGDFFPKLFQLLGISDDFVWFWPPLFTPINDIILVMVGSMALGVIQVFTGMAVSVAEKFRHGQVLDALSGEIAWWLILGGGALAIAASALEGAPAPLGTAGLAVLAAGLAALLAGNLIRARGLSGLVGFGGDIYNGVSGYFSDILSYLRLMALMMAGSIIASVFNTLGSVFGLVPFLIVALVGNTLNLVLNLLGCYVHTMRLQCLEFFGRFYKDGGKPFRPLTVETKYVDVLKEEL